MHHKKLHTTAIHLVMWIAVFFVSGCQSKKSSTRSRQSDRYAQSEVSERFAQLQARLVDIPVPLQAVPAADASDDTESGTDCMLYYRVLMHRQELIHFYMCEMERMGWQSSFVCCAREDLLVFDKPERLCTVSIRPQESDLVVVVSTGCKQPAL